MSPSEFQRAYEGHATQGERQWAGSAIHPEPPRGGPEPRRAAGPQRRRTGGRGALIAVVAVVVLAAVGTVAFLAGKTKPTTTNNAGNVAGGTPSATSPAASPSVSSSAPTQSPSQPPGAAAMATLASYLSQSAAVRPNVSNAVNGVQSCSESPAAAQTTIQQAITARQNILNGLQTLSVGALPNGAQLVSALRTAMQNSLDADNDYHAWMTDLASSGNSCGSNANQDSHYVAAGNADSAATTSKEAFVNLWNPMAPTYDQPTYTDTGF
jgi:eukaryotic-like serine/threonine-protein kinase